MKNENPFPECSKCRDLSDCPEPDISQDLLGRPLPPQCCPKPNKIMAQTEKRKKRYDRDTIRNAKDVRP